MSRNRQVLEKSFLNASDALKEFIDEITNNKLAVDDILLTNLKTWEHALYTIGYSEAELDHQLQKENIKNLQAHLKSFQKDLNQECWAFMRTRKALMDLLETLSANINTYLFESRQSITQSNLPLESAKAILKKTEIVLHAAKTNKVIRERLNVEKILVDLSNVIASARTKSAKSLKLKAEMLYDDVLLFINNHSKKVASYTLAESRVISMPDSSHFQTALQNAFSHLFQGAVNLLKPIGQLTNLDPFTAAATTQEITEKQFRFNRIDLAKNPDVKSTIVFVERLSENQKPRSEIVHLPDQINPAKIMANALQLKRDPAWFEETLNAIQYAQEKINKSNLIKYGLTESEAKICIHAYKAAMTCQFNGYRYPNYSIIELAICQVENFRAAYGCDLAITITDAWTPLYVEAIQLYCATQGYKVINYSRCSIPKEKYHDDPKSIFNLFRKTPVENFKKLIKSNDHLYQIYKNARNHEKINKTVWKNRTSSDSYLTTHKQEYNQSYAQAVMMEAEPIPAEKEILPPVRVIADSELLKKNDLEEEVTIPLNLDKWSDEFIDNAAEPEKTRPSLAASPKRQSVNDSIIRRASHDLAANCNPDELILPDEADQTYWLDEAIHPIPASAVSPNSISIQDLDQAIDTLSKGSYPSLESEYLHNAVAERTIPMRNSHTVQQEMLAKLQEQEDQLNAEKERINREKERINREVAELLKEPPHIVDENNTKQLTADQILELYSPKEEEKEEAKENEIIPQAQQNEDDEKQREWAEILNETVPDIDENNYEQLTPEEILKLYLQEEENADEELGAEELLELYLKENGNQAPEIIPPELQNDTENSYELPLITDGDEHEAFDAEELLELYLEANSSEASDIISQELQNEFENFDQPLTNDENAQEEVVAEEEALALNSIEEENEPAEIILQNLSNEAEGLNQPPLLIEGNHIEGEHCKELSDKEEKDDDDKKEDNTSETSRSYSFKI